jgi:glycosyltransferase involved in cell wall biosynthesis
VAEHAETRSESRRPRKECGAPLTGEATRSPRLSVLLAVYNAERFLAQAVESILAQSFSDFEFIIVDDGSTDASREILQRYEDPRIRLISRDNRGLTVSLNEALDLARGELVARQDADDMSEVNRLSRQVDYLDRHRPVGLVGTNYVLIDEDGAEVVTTNLFTHPDDLKVAQVLANQFCHGSVMFRRAMIDEIGEYDPAVGHVEDYDLFARMTHAAASVNLREPLYRWRLTPTGISLSRRDLQADQSATIREREFSRLCARRNEYRVFSSFHPFSLRTGAFDYLDRKGSLYRDFAVMCAVRGLKRQALTALLLACVCEPWRRRNLRAVVRVLRGDPVNSLPELEALFETSHRVKQLFSRQ